MAATAVGSTMPAVGALLGFLLGPAIVHRPSQLPVLLYVEAVASAASLFFALLYLPRKPPSPPSAAAAARAPSKGTAEFLAEMPLALRQLPFVAVVLSLASAFGVFTSWIALVPASIVSAGFSEADANAFLLSNTLATVAGGFSVGPCSRVYRSCVGLKGSVLGSDWL